MHARREGPDARDDQSVGIGPAPEVGRERDGSARPFECAHCGANVAGAVVQNHDTRA